MNAIILAAGVGRRLGGSPRPKCLLDLGDRTLLEHQARALVAVGVHDVVVAVGHAADQVVAHALALPLPIRWTFRPAPHYATSNTLWTLAACREALRGGAFVLNGDVLLGPQPLDRLLRAGGSRLAVEVRACGDEEVKVEVDRDDRVLSLSKEVPLDRSLGEAIGVSLFDAAWGEALAAALAALADERHRNAYYEAAIQAAIRAVPDAHPLRVTRLDGDPVVEIDFPDDLTRARRDVLPRLRAVAGPAAVGARPG